MGGRVALSACLHGLGLSPGDEVILPGYTCVVVRNALLYEGLIPVYVDIELDTYGPDLRQIEGKLSAKTKAILIHHLYGLVCRDLDAILALAAKHDLKVIEDCAHATGAEYRGRKVGNWGDVGFYSSEQSKIFNTVQGGIAVTNDDRIASRLREYYEAAPLPPLETIRRQLANLLLNYFQMSDPARWWKGDVAEILYGNDRLVSTSDEEELGIRPDSYGCRMPSAIAEIGLNQLAKIDRFNEARRVAARRWDAWCDKNGYRKPLVVADSVPVFLRYPVLVEPELKADTSWASEDLGVDVGVWFVSNVHPADVKLEDCANANIAVECCTNLPCLG
jgi:perosamine synthetase